MVLKERIKKAWEWLKSKVIEFWRIILSIVLGGAVVGASLGADPTGMTEVGIATERAEYIFECAGVLTSEIVLGSDYDARFEKNGNESVPVKDGCLFKRGRRFYVFSDSSTSTSGTPQRGNYAKNFEKGVQKYYIHLDSGRYLNLTQKELDDLQSLR